MVDLSSFVWWDLSHSPLLIFLVLFFHTKYLYLLICIYFFLHIVFGVFILMSLFHKNALHFCSSICSLKVEILFSNFFFEKIQLVSANWHIYHISLRLSLRFRFYIAICLYKWYLVSSRLLNSLTQALENAGLDLLQANISVQINLGKRSDRKLMSGTSIEKVCSG